MPDLTIVMPTYNKAQYVGEALASVFAQKTAYSYQIIVADDCSSDGTLDVVARHEAEHPGLIRVLRSHVNQKLFRNVVRAYALVRTPYFCVLDPDDWWSAGDIVQRALDFLSTHADFTIYSANCKVLALDGTSRPYSPLSSPVDSSFDDFLGGRGALGQTAGLFYRNVVFANGLPAPLAGALRPDQEMTFRGDGFRNFIHLHEGRAHFEPGQLAVYRQTPEGLWQGTSELRREVLNILLFLNLDEYFGCDEPSLFAFLGRKIRELDAAFPALLKVARDGADASECLTMFRQCRRRFAEEHGVGRRQSRELGLRQRLLYGLWKRLGRRAERKGWT